MKYYLIYRRESETLSSFMFIVSSKEIAQQFCKDHPEFYYLSREEALFGQEEEI